MLSVDITVEASSTGLNGRTFIDEESCFVATLKLGLGIIRQNDIDDLRTAFWVQFKCYWCPEERAVNVHNTLCAHVESADCFVRKPPKL